MSNTPLFTLSTGARDYRTQTGAIMTAFNTGASGVAGFFIDVFQYTGGDAGLLNADLALAANGTTIILLGTYTAGTGGGQGEASGNGLLWSASGGGILVKNTGQIWQVGNASLSTGWVASGTPGFAVLRLHGDALGASTTAIRGFSTIGDGCPSYLTSPAVLGSPSAPISSFQFTDVA